MGDYTQRLEERETILTTDEAADEWVIYTQSARMMRLFSEFATEYPGLCRVKAEDDKYHAKTFIVAKSAVTIRPKRPMTEKQREARRQSAFKHGFGRKETDDDVV